MRSAIRRHKGSSLAMRGMLLVFLTACSSADPEFAVNTLDEFSITVATKVVPPTTHDPTTPFTGATVDQTWLISLGDRISRVFADEIVSTALETDLLILYVEEDFDLVRGYVEELPESQFIEVRQPPVSIAVMQHWQAVVTEALLEANLLNFIDIGETEGTLRVWVEDEKRAIEILATLGVPSQIKLEVIEGAGLVNQ